MSTMELALAAIESGQALVIFNMDLMPLGEDGIALREHEDGSVDLTLRLVPGSSKHCFVLDSRFHGCTVAHPIPKGMA